MKKSKPKDNFRVPVDDAKLVKPPTDVPAVVPVGHLVQFIDRTGEHDVLTGWVVQNSMSPGGQTDSYLIVPYFQPGGEYEDSDTEYCYETGGTHPYTMPHRIQQEDIIDAQSILELELDI